MRSESSSEAQRVRAERDGDATARSLARRPPSVDELQQFRNLLETKPPPEGNDVLDPLAQKLRNVLDDGGDDGAVRRKNDSGENDAKTPADVSALLLAQRLMAQNAPSAAASATSSSPPPQLAELIEKQVTRILVSEGARTGARDASVHLKLADAVLPGTELSLTRHENGWRLRAEVRARDSYDRICDCGDELVRRFAERGLGAIEFEPVLHV
jgi:hypothetical protein